MCDIHNMHMCDIHNMHLKYIIFVLVCANHTCVIMLAHAMDIHEHHTHTRTPIHPHKCARALSLSLSLSLSLIPALTRTNTHAFAHIFMSACMHAPMCMVRVSRYKRECVDCTYTHVHACRCVYLHTRAHTHAHMYIQTPMHYRERVAYEQCS